MGCGSSESSRAVRETGYNSEGPNTHGFDHTHHAVYIRWLYKTMRSRPNSPFFVGMKDENDAFMRITRHWRYVSSTSTGLYVARRPSLIVAASAAP